MMHTSHNKHRSGAQITDSELDVSCDTRGGGGGALIHVCGRRSHLEDLVLDGKIILKQILMKPLGRAWNGLIWQMIALLNTVMNLWAPEMREFLEYLSIYYLFKNESFPWRWFSVNYDRVSTVYFPKWY